MIKCVTWENKDMPDLVAVAVNVDTTGPTSANQPLVMILMMILIVMVVHVIDNDVDCDGNPCHW